MRHRRFGLAPARICEFLEMARTTCVFGMVLGIDIVGVDVHGGDGDGVGVGRSGARWVCLIVDMSCCAVGRVAIVAVGFDAVGVVWLLLVRRVIAVGASLVARAT